MRQKREYIVVSVGGSLIVPDGIDTGFLRAFHALITEKVRQGFSFYIVAGGGQTARRYQQAAHEVRGDLSDEDADWLGIHATRLNGHLLRALFNEYARPRLVKDPTRALHARVPVVVGAGWRPGWSTDYCAVLAAKKLGATKLVNLSDTDYVYDKDPDEHPDAKPFEHISWNDFRALIPEEWDPGLSAPFDPVAAREAQMAGLEVVVMNGRKLDEFRKYLDGERFDGTLIK